MTIRFNLNFASLLALQKDVIEHSHTHLIKKAYFKWISTIILFVIALLIMKVSLLSVGLSAMIAMGYFFLFPIIYHKVTLSKLKKQMEKIDYDNVLGTCEVMISNIGIDRKLHNKNTHFKWGNFESWREDQAYYFLYVTDLEGLIISKQPDRMNEQEKARFNEDFKKELHKNITEKGAS